MDISSHALRKWLRDSGPLGPAVLGFARQLGGRSALGGRLFVLGPPEFEPWHFTRHLAENCHHEGRHDLIPHLLRWRIPDGAPPHLATPVDQLFLVGPGDRCLAICPHPDPGPLVNLVATARSRGATVLTTNRDGGPLATVGDHHLTVDRSCPLGEFDRALHALATFAPLQPSHGTHWWGRHSVSA